MTSSLYEISVPSYLQTLGATGGFMEKAVVHFQEKSVNVVEIVETRLYSDMLPFRFQIQALVQHSVGAIEGLKNGLFKPPTGLPSSDYRELQKLVADAQSTLHSISPETVNACAGREMIFEIRGTRIPFTAEGFVTSFSLPNFYFHATTAYDILRSKGVPLGKRDFLGRMRLKT
jgi:uncharacterized protein